MNPINFRAADEAKELSLSEMGELERMIDGPISEVAIQDKIGLRGACAPKQSTPSELADLIAFLRSDRGFYAREAERLESEISQMMADRDAMYSPNESDRKTVHINAVIRSRDDVLETVKFYDEKIKTAVGELAAFETALLAAE